MAVGVCASGRIGVGYARRASMDGTECDNYLHAGPEVRFLVISRSLQLFWPHTQWQGRTLAAHSVAFFNFFLSQKNKSGRCNFQVHPLSPWPCRA